MQNSNIKELWNQIKLLNKMEIPSLSYSKNLVKTPNFHSSGLEKLILRSLLRNWIYQETDPLNLPSRVTCLSKLERVFVMNCIDLLSISEFPSCSKEFYALHFTSMERLWSHTKTIPPLFLSGCQKLIEIHGMKGVSVWPILLDDRSNVANNFKKTLAQALFKGEHSMIFNTQWWDTRLVQLYGDRSSLSFYVPAVADWELQALVIWLFT